MSNPEYIAAAKEMLSANTQERLAVEELAAAVGLDRSKLLIIIVGVVSSKKLKPQVAQELDRIPFF